MTKQFSEEEIELIAKQVGFVRRSSKMSGVNFLDLVVFNNEYLKSQSLNNLAIEFEKRTGIEIEKQSIHERFNESAVKFLKKILEKIIENQMHERIFLEKLHFFNRILIKDSVCFQIDKSLSQIYPGSGGDGSKASVRIQFEYDFLSGKINDLSINPFNEQDAKNSKATIGLTKAGDLIIRDLAYMSLDVLQAIEAIAAFFLCRLSPNVTVYENKNGAYVKIDFVKLAKYIRANNLNQLEKEIYIGSKEKYKVRLVLYLLPHKEYAKRIRNAKKNNTKKGGDGNLSQEYRARAALNLFITNCNAEFISAKNIWSLYRLRWQIELVFKIWKSICDIDGVKKVNQHRLECYIYSKLIVIVLCWQLIWKIARYTYHEYGKILSFYKMYKTILGDLRELREIFITMTLGVSRYLIDLVKRCKDKNFLESKKGSLSSAEIVLILGN